jgi:hypothetical protein
MPRFTSEVHTLALNPYWLSLAQRRAPRGIANRELRRLGDTMSNGVAEHEHPSRRRS